MEWDWISCSIAWPTGRVVGIVYGQINKAAYCAECSKLVLRYARL
jgi:hypothetical protein